MYDKILKLAKTYEQLTKTAKDNDPKTTSNFEDFLIKYKVVTKEDNGQTSFGPKYEKAVDKQIYRIKEITHLIENLTTKYNNASPEAQPSIDRQIRKLETELQKLTGGRDRLVFKVVVKMNADGSTSVDFKFPFVHKNAFVADVSKAGAAYVGYAKANNIDIVPVTFIITRSNFRS